MFKTPSSRAHVANSSRYNVSILVRMPSTLRVRHDCGVAIKRILENRIAQHCWRESADLTQFRGVKRRVERHRVNYGRAAGAYLGVQLAQ